MALVPVKKRNETGLVHHPVEALQRRMNRMFDDFFGDWGIEPFGWFERENRFVPSLNINETDKDYKITAELPGMDEKDIELNITDGVVTLSGEKKQESEDKGKGWHRIERSYGSFSRSVQLPGDIDEEKVQAELKKGVLTITLPKTPQAQSKTKKIDIKTEEK